MHLLYPLLITVSAFLVESIMQLFIYFAINPYGSPYISNAGSSYIQALFYSAIVLFFLSWPFLGLSCFKKLKDSRIYVAQMIVFFLYLCINHADRELIRFMGNHYSLTMMTTYTVTGADSSTFIVDTIGHDQRGAYSAFILILFPIAWLTLGLTFKRRILNKIAAIKIEWSPRKQKIACALMAGISILFPLLSCLDFVKTDRTYGTHYLGLSRPQLKVSPLPIALLSDIRSFLKAGSRDYSQIDAQIDRVQTLWKQGSSDPNWVFTSHDRPLLKTYKGECVKREKQPNIVLILVESLHSTFLQDFNPKAETQIMPWLHSVVTGENAIMNANGLHSTVYDRYFTNGQPTIDALLAIHTGLPPHSYHNVSGQFLHNRSTPSMITALRAHNYYTGYIDSISGSFDSKEIWMNRWYDHYVDLFTWEDRISLTRLSDQIIEHRKDDRPFMLTLEMVSNHVPFNLPETEPALPEDMPLADRSRKVITYDDREFAAFFDRLDKAGALSDTIFLITGDHGYDFGEYQNPEHSETGYNALRANIIWLPMVIISPYDWIPRGRQSVIASHADIAPTLMEMAGICDDNSYAGHSLLSAAQNTALNCISGNFAYIDDRYQSIFIEDEAPQLYSTSDMAQEKDVHRDHSDIIEAMRKDASDWRNVLDYTYEGDRF